MASKNVRGSAWAAALLLLLPGWASAAEPPAMSVGVFDTGISSPSPLPGVAVVQRDGWTELPEDETAHQFEGDAVLSNGRLTLVFRRGARGAELYGHGRNGATLRAALVPSAEKAASRLASVAVAENTPGEAALVAAFRMPDGSQAAVRFALPRSRYTTDRRIKILVATRFVLPTRVKI